MTRLDGQHAVVTGGGRGIGRAIAATLTAAGASVTICGRDARVLEETVWSGAARHAFAADVTDAPALRAGLQAASATHGAVSIFVANAGGAETAAFAKADPESFRRMFDLNVLSVVNGVQAVLGGMIAQKAGRIVAIASTAGLRGFGYASAYCAAKHAVVGLVRALAQETAKAGVTVNAVCPGYTDTDMLRQSVDEIVRKTGRTLEQAQAPFEASAPIGRLIQPDEVAAAVLYLCSGAAGAVTGTTLTVAGGEL